MLTHTIYLVLCAFIHLFKNSTKPRSKYKIAGTIRVVVLSAEVNEGLLNHLYIRPNIPSTYNRLNARL